MKYYANVYNEGTKDVKYIFHGTELNKAKLALDESGGGRLLTLFELPKMNRQKVAKFSLEEIYEIFMDMPKKLSPRKQQWVSLLEAAGDKLVCPITKLVVHHVEMDAIHFTRKGRLETSYHYNFYSECGRMFTVDHIIPRSKGGSVFQISNLQAMIAEENFKKGDKVFDIPKNSSIVKTQQTIG